MNEFEINATVEQTVKFETVKHSPGNVWLSGVYNETYEQKFDGGPECASESDFRFKVLVTIALVSFRVI